jgi:thymidylate kinase
MDHNISEGIKKEASNLNEFKPSSKGLVVEFVGQVGCGKTTNCDYFFEMLKENGFIVYVLSDLKKYFNNMKYLNKYYIILNTLFFTGVDLLRFTLVLARHGIISFDSIIRYSKLCVMNMVLQQFIVKRKFDVLLLDQWIIQGLWSATIFKLNSYDVLHEKLRRFYFKTDVVLYFNIDTATASKRIESRDTNTSRFDRMDAGKRLVELKKYNAYLFQLYENSNCKNKLEFSALVSPEKNAEDFLHQLKHTITYE